MCIFTNLGMGPRQYDDAFRRADDYMQRHHGLTGTVQLVDMNIEMDFTEVYTSAVIFKNFADPKRHYTLINPHFILTNRDDLPIHLDIRLNEINKVGRLEIIYSKLSDFSHLPRVPYNDINILDSPNIRDFTTVPGADTMCVKYSGIRNLKGLDPNTRYLNIVSCEDLDSIKGIPTKTEQVDICTHNHNDIDRLLFSVDNLPKYLYIYYTSKNRSPEDIKILPVTIEHLKNTRSKNDVNICIECNNLDPHEYCLKDKKSFKKKDGHLLNIYMEKK